METLKDRIKRHEGFRARPYADSLGKLTIGYGRCLTSNGIAEDEAEFMLDNDIEEAQMAVAQVFKWAYCLDTARQSVLVEMVFQLGVHGVLQFTKMLTALQGGNYLEASKQMLASEWHKQTSTRTEELAEIMLNGGIE